MSLQPNDIDPNKARPMPAGVDPSVLEEVDVWALDREVLKLERNKCRKNLFFLAHDILGYKDMDTDWHRKLCAHMDRTMGQDSRNRLFLLPRGTFKTTLCTIADSIRLALCDPNIRIAVMSSTSGHAERMLRELKWHLMQNRRLRRIFPEYAPPQKDWGTKTECAVPCRTVMWGEGTFNAIGTEEHVVSNHYYWFKKDDCQDDQNATNVDQLNSLDRWDRRTRALGYPVKDAHHDYIGTRWAVKDLYQRIMARMRNLVTIERDAERGPDGEEGQLLVPTILPQETLNELKEEMGSSLYMSQYRLKPHDPETADFKEEDLNLCRTDAMLSPEEVNFAVIIDPGFFERRGTSETGIIVQGTDPFGEPWIVDGIAGKFGTRQVAAHAFALAKKWKALWLFVEQITNEAVKEELERLIAADSFKVAVYVITYQKRSKPMRILRAQPWVERHALHLCNRCPVVQMIIDQYIEFPNGLNDLIDAISMGLEHALPKMVDHVEPPEPAHVRYVEACMSENPDPRVVATQGHDDRDYELVAQGWLGRWN